MDPPPSQEKDQIFSNFILKKIPTKTISSVEIGSIHELLQCDWPQKSFNSPYLYLLYVYVPFYLWGYLCLCQSIAIYISIYLSTNVSINLYFYLCLSFVNLFGHFIFIFRHNFTYYSNRSFMPHTTMQSFRTTIFLFYASLYLYQTIWMTSRGTSQ